jgi:hypothetical protein
MTQTTTETSHPHEILLGSCKRLSLHAAFADIQIVPAAEGQSPCIIAAHGYQLDPQSIQISINGDHTSVNVSNSISSWWRSFWERRTGRLLVLYVPRDVDAEIHTSAGRVRVSQLRNCTLLVANEAGSTRLEDVHGKLTLSSEAGEIRGDNLSGSFDVTASAGEVRLSVLDVDPGEHRIQASMGAIKLLLAKGLPVSFEPHAPLGSVRLSYPATAGAPARFVLTADMGEIKVREYTKTAEHSERRAYHIHAELRGEPQPRPEENPYRSASTIEPETLDRILAKVADGTLQPQTAAELIRALRSQ